ncbi:hypothetical protein CsSME_00034838 [Camellia sinensis var. sinensis]
MPWFDFCKVQVPLVAASMALHTFIHKNSVDDEIFVAVSSAAEYKYMDMADQDDLAALYDVMMPGDNDVEMAQLRVHIRAELVAIWRNTR